MSPQAISAPPDKFISVHTGYIHGGYIKISRQCRLIQCYCLSGQQVHRRQHCLVRGGEQESVTCYCQLQTNLECRLCKSVSTIEAITLGVGLT